MDGIWTGYLIPCGANCCNCTGDEDSSWNLSDLYNEQWRLWLCFTAVLWGYFHVSGSFSGGIGRGYCNCIPPVSGVYYAGIVFVHVFLRQFSVGQENGCAGGISLYIFTDSSGGHFYPVCGRRGTGIRIFTDRSAWFLSDRDRAEEAIDRLDSLIDRYVRTDIFPYYIHSSYRDSFNTPLHCLYKKNLEE